MKPFINYDNGCPKGSDSVKFAVDTSEKAARGCEKQDVIYQRFNKLK